MSNGAKVAAAVVGGYVLGRRKKAKLAITMGAWLIGKKLNINPKQLVSDVGKELASSPQLSDLREQVRGEVFGAGKSMAGSLLNQQTEKLADSLRRRTERLNGAEDGESTEDSTEESETADESAPKQNSGSRSGGRQAATKRTEQSGTKQSGTKQSGTKQGGTKQGGTKQNSTRQNGTRTSAATRTKAASGTRASASRSTNRSSSTNRRDTTGKRG